MDGCRVTLTPGTTLRFGSLGFVYIGRWSPSLGAPSPGRLAPMSSRGGYGTRFGAGYFDHTFLQILKLKCTEE
jgi:hypothetical protein